MSTNVSFEFKQAEKAYLAAQTDEDKLAALEKLWSVVPSHKGAEALRANIRTRIKKLREKIDGKKKQKKQTARKEGIKKEEMQAVLIGLTKSGKSSLLSCLTNAKPEISPVPYTTKSPLIGMLEHNSVKIQIIDMPAIESEYFDQGIVNTADTLIIIITKISELGEIMPFIEKSLGKRIIVFNKIDLLSEQEKLKAEATLKTKKYNFCIISCKTKQGIEELKEKIWQSFDKIRVYTKEPGKQATAEPIVLDKGASVKDVAEKILHGFSSKVQETRITGPSSKFPNQKVSLEHKLKDKDVVEFHVK